MLHALGFPDEQMPKFLVHGWWNISGAKMSKSLGNVVDPDVLADKYGAEALRYYLMSDMVIGKDADFSEERLIATLQRRSCELVRQSAESSTLTWHSGIEVAGYPVGRGLGPTPRLCCETLQRKLRDSRRCTSIFEGSTISDKHSPQAANIRIVRRSNCERSSSQCVEEIAPLGNSPRILSRKAREA